MNNDYYNLAKKNGWNSKFLEQLKTTNNSISDSYGQQKKAINTKYDNSINQFNPQKEQANQTAYQTGRNAYVNYMKNINPFNANQNSLARSGMANSGYAESLGLKANNDYQTNVGNALTTRNLALANIENQINDLENQRQSDLSDLSLNENSDLLENYYKIMQLNEDEKKRNAVEKKKSSSKSGNSGSTYTYTSTPSTSSSPKSSKKSTPKQNAKNYTSGGGGYTYGGGGKNAFGGSGSMGGRGGGSRGKKTKLQKIAGKILNYLQFL